MKYKFVPQPDITAYELARLVSVFMSKVGTKAAFESVIAALPEECKRHIEVSEEGDDKEKR